MLPGQTEVRPENNVAPNVADVNDLFDTCVSLSDSICASLFENLIYILQKNWLREDLGRPWNKEARAGPLVCPRCSHKSFIRRGWRSRKIRTSRGTYQIRLAQVSCRRCQRVFRPYALRLGIPSTLRFLPEVEEKMIDLATQLPYGRSGAILSRLIGVRVSCETIRRRIFRKGSEEKARSLPETVEHCMVDDTKVKAGKRTRGEEVHMAISVERGPLLYGRPTLKKDLLFLSLGGPKPLKKVLKQLNPQRLVHDGFLNLSGCAQKVQRCRWHLPNDLRIILSMDGIRWRNTVVAARELREILWQEGSLAYDRFTRMLGEHGFRKSATYLKNARKEIFAHSGDESFEFTTTSPLEREMRELNRRMDVGARWSTQGAENMARVLFTRRFRHRNQVLKEQELLEPG